MRLDRALMTALVEAVGLSYWHLVIGLADEYGQGYRIT